MANFFKKQIKSEEKDIKDIWRRIRKRDFSGNTGLAVKNSIYNTLQTFAAKAGSLIFTIILARLLMPELFGLYSLALSTILIFAVISKLGVNQSLVRFVSWASEKKKKKVKGYIFYFGKIKGILILLSILSLLIFSKFLAETYYQKPIFLALLAGIFYVAFTQISSFLWSLLNSFNNFKSVFFGETFFQVLRIVFVPLTVIYALKISLSEEGTLFLVIFFLALAYLISGIYLFFVSKKEIILKLKDTKKQKKLSSKEKRGVNKFIFLSSAIVLSEVFFGNIDKVMLGKFVAGEFIGYYQAAFSLVGALVSLGMFGGVLLPIFSRMEKKSLDKVFKKSLKIVSLISAGVFVLTILFSDIAVSFVYGKDYLLATNVLRLLAVLIFIIPITNMHLAYFTAKNKLEIVAKSLMLSTVLNIFLNYFLITFFLQYGEISAVYGAVIATIISQGVHFGILAWRRKE